jgi:CBS domain-containing protein
MAYRPTLPISPGSSKLTAEQLLTPCSICIPQDLSIDAARDVFRDDALALLPVIDRRGRPIGFLSRTALERPSRRLVGAATVREIMSPVATSVRASASLSVVEDLVGRQRRMPLPVIDDEGRLLGLIETPRRGRLCASGRESSALL